MSAADRGETEKRQTRHRYLVLRWLVLFSPLFVPWVVIRTEQTTLLYPWGSVVLESAHLVWLPTFFEQPGPTPQHLRSWPIGTAWYLLAVVWSAGWRFGADQRVTAGLFALLAFTVFSVSSGFGIDPNTTAVPLGSVLALVIAGWIIFGHPSSDVGEK